MLTFFRINVKVVMLAVKPAIQLQQIAQTVHWVTLITPLFLVLVICFVLISAEQGP